MEQSCKIRQAEPCDELEIRRIAEASYAIYLPRMDRRPFPMLDDYATHIANGAVYVLEEEGRLMGYIVLLPAEDNSLLLDNIAVDSSQQKKGYGRILAAFAEDEARRRGLEAVSLYTNEAMWENLEWYPKLGYEETGRRRDKGYNRVFFRKKL